MKKKLQLLILFAGLFQIGFSQKPIKTPSKEVLFKTPAYWKEQQDNKLKAAPESVKALLGQKNKELEKKGKTLRLGYTGVYNVPLATITGFNYNGKRDIPLDSRPLDGPPPPMCLSITATANDRKVDMRDYGIITTVRYQDNCGGCWAFACVAAFETAELLKNGGDATNMNLSVAQLLSCCGTVPGRCGGGIQGDGIGYIKDHFIA